MAELVDIARRWQAVEPDNEDAHYYLCKQRLLCGEGKACWPIFAISGSVIPPRRRTTCCWAGAASTGLISSAGGDGGRSALYGGCRICPR